MRSTCTISAPLEGRRTGSERVTRVKVGADHLLAVDGVEAGQGAAPPSRAVAVQLGVCEAPRFILLQLVTPAVPRHPAVCTRRLCVHKGLWGRRVG